MPIDNLRDSHSRREFTRVFRALERCRDARDEMELHCLSAANPFFFRVARVGQRHEDEEKFFPCSGVRGLKNDGGDIPAGVGDADRAARHAPDG